MNITLDVDDSAFQTALQSLNLSPSTLLDFSGVGAAVLINGMRRRVPVDTGATRASVSSHITENSAVRVVDEVGPETEYAVDIEYGVPSKPNYPIQPFVRPTAFEDEGRVQSAIGNTFGNAVVQKWP